MGYTIYSRLTVGLGNQLFQYAAGYALAKKNGFGFSYDVDSPLACGGRYNEVAKFDVTARSASVQKLKKESFFFVLNGALQKVVTRSQIIGYGLFGDFFLEDGKGSFFEEKSHSLYLVGHWLSYKYFAGFENEIRSEFKAREALSNASQAVKEDIKKNTAVSVHIRRGDYLNPEQLSFHGVCSLDYYEEAADYIQRKLGDVKFYIFSDDISWAKENIKLGDSQYFVDHNGADDAYQDLLLMSECNSHIIANSTFSWWGAWLNNDDSKIVVAPQKWFLNPEKNNSTKDLIYSDWIRI